MKKLLIGFPLLLVGLLAAVPWVAPMLDVQISYTDMYHWVIPKAKKKAEPRPEVTEPPKTYEASKCNETLDLDKFPVTPLNGKVYAGEKATDVLFKSGQARIKGNQIELKLFSSEARASCKDTAADGAVPQDTTLIMSLSKNEFDQGKNLFKSAWDEFVNTLDYYYVQGAVSAPASTPTSAGSMPASAPAAENPMKKENKLLQGRVAEFSLDPKAGGKAKGKAILCFAQPSPNATPITVPEGEDPPPPGIRHAIAGNFEIEFCP